MSMMSLMCLVAVSLSLFADDLKLYTCYILHMEALHYGGKRLGPLYTFVHAV